MKKIKSIVYIVLLIFLTSFFLGCVGTQKAEPKADGKALYTYLTKDNNYKNWKMWPGKGKMYPTTAHGAAFLTSYVNDIALSAIEGKKGSMPDESIIVKENYGTDKKLVALTVLYKESGYDPEHNDWFWAKYAPNGTVQAEGKVKACYDCHSQKKDNDYIFTSELK